MSQNKKNIQALTFSHSKGIEKPTEQIDKRGGYIKWGKKNDYPFYLIDMFNGSAWHQGIIKAKTFYISGGGFLDIAGAEPFIENVNSDYTIDEIVKNITLDFELFDGFVVCGTWNREGTKVVRWEHLDFDKCRLSIDGKTIMYSDDWGARKQDPDKTGYKEFPLLNSKEKKGKFAIYYTSPSKQAKDEKGYYPKPTYVGGLTAINTDVLISKYHLYEIQNGFKGGTLVNFANGQPETSEEENAIRQQVKGSSSDIEDTNTIVITFSDGADNAPSVMQLNGNDLADRYERTEKAVQQNILVCHNAINPLLFGIKTEGQLGGAQELMQSYEIFKKLYVNARQESIEYIFNYMAELSGYNVNLQLDTPLPIGTPEPQEPQTPAIEQQSKFSVEDDLKVFEEYGKKKEHFKIVKSVPVRNDFTSEDVEQMERTTVETFDTIGQIRAAINETDRNILNLLKNGENAQTISDALELPVRDVTESIEKLKGLNLYNDGSTTDLANDILEGLDTGVDDFEIVYTYEVKPGLGAEIIPTTRDFCRRLISQDRAYTKSELDTISGRIGRDVFRYRGGFYHNPDTDRTTPWCRHEWKQNIVLKN